MISPEHLIIKLDNLLPLLRSRIVIKTDLDCKVESSAALTIPVRELSREAAMIKDTYDQMRLLHLRIYTCSSLLNAF